MSDRSWSGFHTVLCAIDFSEPSRHALRHAAVVAAHAHGRLVVLFVNDPLLVGVADAARPRLDVRAQSVKELDRFVRSTLGGTKATSVERRVATGEPADQILALVRRIGADLLVVGGHGLTGVSRLAFGSTTMAVLKRSPVPILVVPANDAVLSRTVSWPRGRIVAPVLLDRRTGSDVNTASRVAAWFGCSLLLVHVCAVPAVPAWLGRRLAGRNANQREAARRQLVAVAASKSRVPTSVHVPEGLPADEIAAVAKREKPALVMTMLRDRRHWFDTGRGALTYRTFTRISMPVLACPPRWRPR